MKRALAKCVTSSDELRDLGIMGFGVKESNIATALTNNNNSITEAARVVISTWSDDYEDAAEAFEDLCKILKKIGKAAWITAIKKVKK